MHIAAARLAVGSRGTDHVPCSRVARLLAELANLSRQQAIHHPAIVCAGSRGLQSRHWLTGLLGYRIFATPLAAICCRGLDRAPRAHRGLAGDHVDLPWQQAFHGLSGVGIRSRRLRGAWSCKGGDQSCRDDQQHADAGRKTL